MDGEFKNLLADAKGESAWIICVMLDVRDFTSSNLMADSIQTGLFIKTMYSKLLGEFFPTPSYFKPTGDGLLLVYEVNENAVSDLQKLGKVLVTACCNALEEFPHFFDKHILIKPPIPDRLGIGMTIGPVCRLVSGGQTLDYSGRMLNLCSRLMEQARPSGLVIEAALGDWMLPEDIGGRFKGETIYPKGYDASQGVKVFYTSDLTIIPQSAKTPGVKEKWANEETDFALKELKVGSLFYHLLKRAKKKPEKLQVYLLYQKSKAEFPQRNEVTGFCSHEVHKGRPVVVLAHSVIQDFARSLDIPLDKRVRVEYFYTY